MRRKVQELILAARIERTYSKAEILDLYLNKVYFGDGLYGVEAASRGYFGKHASELSVSEAATLAGLVQSPSAYSPTVNAERAIGRRNVVLQALLETGGIDRATWESARAASLDLRDTLRAGEPHGQYFREQVRQELVERFGSERVYEGGLRVFSTIDMRAQVAAEESIAATLQAVEARRTAIAARRGTRRGTVPTQSADPPLQAALVAMDPGTGHVRAMVGGRDFAESPFNRATQARRQPGSAFKPFVFAAALEAGFTPASIVDRLDEPIPTFEGDWTPEDGHADAAAQMSLRAALRTSSNRAAVRLLQEVGISSAANQAEAMGVGDQPEVPSLALGSGEVTLQALTAAYAAFANHGRVPRPLLIRRVEDRDGQVLYAAEDSSTPAISDATAYLMADMLAGVIDAGTGARARQLGFRLPAAGKTGTTNDFKDAWFVGFTPALIAGVWVGFDEPRTILPNGFASNVAVPVWAAFMKAATRGHKPEWLDAPASIVTAHVCAESGRLATEACERGHAYTEFFSEGTQPTTFCDIHRPRNVFGAIASLFTSEEKPPPPGLEETGVQVSVPPPPPAPQVAAPPVEEPRASEPPARKRGFWSRVFGIGRNGRQDDGGTTRNGPAPSR
jgi:penicillin-binding protein 1A